MNKRVITKLVCGRKFIRVETQIVLFYITNFRVVVKIKLKNRYSINFILMGDFVAELLTEIKNLKNTG